MTTVLYRALCACLGLTPGSAAADTLITPAYAEPEPAPQAPRERNVIYFSVLRDDSARPRPQAYTVTGREGSEAVTAIRSLLAYRLIIACYGPEAEQHAHRIRSMLYVDGSGKPRSILRKAGIYPVPHPPQPLLLYETAHSLYRPRADLEIPIRVADELSAKVPGITVAPKVNILYR